MSNKENNSIPTGKLEYEEILEEEIINAYERKLEADSDINKKDNRYYRLKRTPLEIINRLLFFSFLGSFIFSFFLAYRENKILFIYVEFVTLKLNTIVHIISI